MKNITKLREKFLMSMCILTTMYCLFFYELIESSCLPTVMYTLTGLWILLIVISVFELIGFLVSKKRTGKKLYYQSDGFVSFICIYSQIIVSYCFYIYFFIYFIFDLYKDDIIFNYILLIILGVFIGYKIAFKSIIYLEKRK